MPWVYLAPPGRLDRRVTWEPWAKTGFQDPMDMQGSRASLVCQGSTVCQDPEGSLGLWGPQVPREPLDLQDYQPMRPPQSPEGTRTLLPITITMFHNRVITMLHGP